MYKIVDTSAFLSNKKRTQQQKTAARSARFATGGIKIKVSEGCPETFLLTNSNLMKKTIYLFFMSPLTDVFNNRF